LKNKDHSIVIWTTTPWTIPGNRALAVHEDIKYASLNIHHKILMKYLIAEDLIVNFKEMKFKSNLNFDYWKELLKQIVTTLYINLVMIS